MNLEQLERMMMNHPNDTYTLLISGDRIGERTLQYTLDISINTKRMSLPQAYEMTRRGLFVTRKGWPWEECLGRIDGKMVVPGSSGWRTFAPSLDDVESHEWYVCNPTAILKAWRLPEIPHAEDVKATEIAERIG
jgi:hypothetical protein